ncbi:ABC transporter substrate-binding protein [Halalkalibacterium halodurans]|uniref:ABC transporter substrate-binding protein n=1 Tax=Halalkalibacterium halodurans TaxID=86665 RepID=UPI002AAA4CC2|nr:ABC transporter substrate-binding protein [Halalkalibacterium halodurans]MDY7223287.1 ABC transporter substrate-binding protein [Halalkalibacterium halodurans]MDY7242508.1 ABC transporter substrate-binding protein [Halalkalibacterium halodurans]
MEQNRFKLLFLFILSLVLVVGCSSNNEEAATNSPEQNEEEPEQVTLKWMVTSEDQPDQERVWAEFNERLQDYLPNTTVEFENVSITEYEERWQLVAAAQEPVDIAWNFWENPFVEEVQRGAFMDLTDLIEQYAPALLEELDPFVLDFGKVDGRQYAIPNWQPLVDMRVTMRTTKENFDEFWSVEEAEAAMSRDERPLDEKAFDALTDYFQRLQDGGKEFEVTPRLMTQLQRGQVISEPFVIRMQDENFEVVNMMELPEMQLLFDYARDWYEKGFIRQDIISNPTGDRSYEDGIDPIWSHAYFPNELGEGFPPPTAPTDADPELQPVPLTDQYTISQLTHGTNMVIPSSAENPERAIQLIELMHTEKGRDLLNLLLWGIEGEHYTVVGENRIETIGYDNLFPSNPHPTLEINYGLSPYFTANSLLSYETQAVPEGYWEMMRQLHEDAWKSPLIGFKPDLAPIRTQIAQITSIQGEYFEILFNGVSADYKQLQEEMIERMNQSGAQDVIDELQRQIDEYVAEHVK